MPRKSVGRQKGVLLSSTSILEEWSGYEVCLVCNEPTSAEEFADDLMLICDCCTVKGIHVGCHHKTQGPLTKEQLESPSFQWFCGQECQTIYRSIVQKTGQRTKLPGDPEFTYEIVRYSANYRASQQVIATVVGLFHSAFGATRYSDGTDLVELVCHQWSGASEGSQQQQQHNRSNNTSSKKKNANEDDDEEEEDEIPDCSNFFVLVLRKGGNIVSAAAIRVQGATFAEMPYVATRDGYRREGNCRRLLTAVDTLLHSLGVKWILLPAVEEICGMWMHKFGFLRAGSAVQDAMESHVIVPGGTDLLIKAVQPPSSSSSLLLTRHSSRSTEKAKGSSKTKRKTVRFSLPDEAAISDESNESDDGDDLFEAESEEEEEEAEDEDVELEEEEEENEEEERKNEKGGKLLLNNKTTNAVCNKKNAQSTGDGSPGSSSLVRYCYNCKTEVSPHWHPAPPTGPPPTAAADDRDEDTDKAAGECHLCFKYRNKNDKVRPRHLYKRTARRLADIQQSGSLPSGSFVERKQGRDSSRSRLAAAVPSPGTPSAVIHPFLRPSSSSYPPPTALSRARRLARKRRLALHVLAERKRMRPDPTVAKAKLELVSGLHTSALATSLATTLLQLGQKAKIYATTVPPPPQEQNQQQPPVVQHSHWQVVQELRAQVESLQRDVVRAEREKNQVQRSLASQQAQHIENERALREMREELDERRQQLEKSAADSLELTDKYNKAVEEVAVLQKQATDLHSHIQEVLSTLEEAHTAASAAKAAQQALLQEAEKKVEHYEMTVLPEMEALHRAILQDEITARLESERKLESLLVSYCEEQQANEALFRTERELRVTAEAALVAQQAHHAAEISTLEASILHLQMQLKEYAAKEKVRASSEAVVQGIGDAAQPQPQSCFLQEEVFAHPLASTCGVAQQLLHQYNPKEQQQDGDAINNLSSLEAMAVVGKEMEKQLAPSENELEHQGQDISTSLGGGGLDQHVGDPNQQHINPLNNYKATFTLITQRPPSARLERKPQVESSIQGGRSNSRFSSLPPSADAAAEMNTTTTTNKKKLKGSAATKVSSSPKNKANSPLLSKPSQSSLTSDDDDDDDGGAQGLQGFFALLANKQPLRALAAGLLRGGGSTAQINAAPHTATATATGGDNNDNNNLLLTRSRLLNSQNQDQRHDGDQEFINDHVIVGDNWHWHPSLAAAPGSGGDEDYNDDLTKEEAATEQGEEQQCLMHRPDHHHHQQQQQVQQQQQWRPEDEDQEGGVQVVSLNSAMKEESSESDGNVGGSDDKEKESSDPGGKESEQQPQQEEEKDEVQAALEAVGKLAHCFDMDTE